MAETDSTNTPSRLVMPPPHLPCPPAPRLDHRTSSNRGQAPTIGRWSISPDGGTRRGRSFDGVGGIPKVAPERRQSHWRIRPPAPTPGPWQEGPAVSTAQHEGPGSPRGLGTSRDQVDRLARAPHQ